jgi:hypothetical protein
MLARCVQLLRHLKGDCAPGTVSGDKVRTMGLIATDLLDLVTSQRFHRGQRITAIETWGLNTEHRLLGI